MIELFRREDQRTHVAHFGSNSLLGRHAGGRWQLFTLVEGSGWVAGPDADTRTSAAAGDSFLWSPGESHESGSDDGMTVVIVQSDTPLPPE